MKHYKIVKKTFVSIDKHGSVEENSTFIPYVKVMWWWVHLNTNAMYSCGYISTSDTGFSSLENCEEFILKYHKYYNKIGKYTIETIKKIDLE